MSNSHLIEAVPRKDAVVARSVTRRFGTTAALDGIDLAIRPGEFVALLGRSGSGKSTLLRLLAGLDSPTAGDVQVPQRRMVVFQEPRLLPWKTVLQNVSLGLTDDSPLKLAKSALAEVGLEHRLDAYPATLSGGEAQRTALARALVRNPQLLLLDEPFAALDALTRIRMHGLVEALWVRHNLSVMLITHDVDEALLLADRALVLDKGRIVTALEVDLPRPRELGQPGFLALRKRLLSAIGVNDLTRREGGEISHAVPSEGTPSSIPSLVSRVA
jgi:sulfonate transport system ATP-binding protein